jgi:hypothetical protein
VNPQAPFAFGWPVWSILTLNLYIKVAFNAYGGLEQIAVFAGETKNAARTIVLSAWIAAPAIVVIYVLMTGSMLTYIPAEKIDLAGPIPQVLAAAFGGGAGVWLGRAMILALTMFTIASYSLITAETSRLPMLNTSGQVMFGLYYCAMFSVPLFTGSRFGPRPPWWLIACAISGLTITVMQCVLALVPIVDVNNTWSYAAKVGGTGLLINLVGAGIYWRAKRKTGNRRVA